MKSWKELNIFEKNGCNFKRRKKYFSMLVIGLSSHQSQNLQ